jgi:ribosome recycling factor
VIEIGKLKELEKITRTNVEHVARLGAQTVVMANLINATLPLLNASQRIEIEKIFRHGIEDAMARVDDVRMHEQYHASFITMTNAYLNELRTGSSSKAR